MGENGTLRRCVAVGMAGIVLAGCAATAETTAGATGTSVPSTVGASSGQSDPEPSAAPVAPQGFGSATVRVGGDTYAFTVIQCLRDTRSLITDDVVALAVEGVPVGTPRDVWEPLLGVAEQDDDVLSLLEPVLALGPILQVVRLDRGGDFVSVMVNEATAITTSLDGIHDPDRRFLDVGGTITGTSLAASPDGDLGQLEVEATCP